MNQISLFIFTPLVDPRNSLNILGVCIVFVVKNVVFMSVVVSSFSIYSPIVKGYHLYITFTRSNVVLNITQFFSTAYEFSLVTSDEVALWEFMSIEPVSIIILPYEIPRFALKHTPMEFDNKRISSNPSYIQSCLVLYSNSNSDSFIQCSLVMSKVVIIFFVII